MQRGLCDDCWLPDVRVSATSENTLCVCAVVVCIGRVWQKKLCSLSVSLPCFVIAIFSFWSLVFLSELLASAAMVVRFHLYLRDIRAETTFFLFIIEIMFNCEIFKLFRYFVRVSFPFFSFLSFHLSLSRRSFFNWKMEEWFSIDCIFPSSRLSCINLRIIHFPILPRS